MRFSPTPAEVWRATNSEGRQYFCPHCAGIGLTALCTHDGRGGWLMGASTVAPPVVGSALGDQFVCTRVDAAAPLTWSVALVAAQSPQGQPVAAQDATGLPRAAAPETDHPNWQGHLTAAPCVAELAPAYRQWTALYEQLLRQRIAGMAPALEPMAGSGGWLTAWDLGQGRPLSELVRPHDQVRGVGQRQTARVLVTVAEILLGLHSLGLTHGQLSLSTVTMQAGPAGRQIYQLIPPPLPPVPSQRILEFCTPWQLVGLAPELLLGGLPTPESEVFALGAIAFVLATGRPPFGDLGQPRTMVVGAGRGRSPMLRLWLPESTQEFVEPVTRALALDPARRPTLAQFAAQMVLAERSSRRATVQTNSPANKPEQSNSSRDTHMDLSCAKLQRTTVQQILSRKSREDSSL